MAKIVGNLFNTLADYLGIVGSENVGQIDLEAIQPVLDVEEALRYGVVEHWEFTDSIQHSGSIGETELNLLLRNTAGWNVVRRTLRDQTRQQVTSGITEVIADDRDILITGVAVRMTSTNDNLAYFQVREVLPSAGRRLLFHADAETPDGGYALRGTELADPHVYPLPWARFRPNGGLTTQLRFVIAASDTAACAADFTVQAIAAPHGVLFRGRGNA